VRVTYTNGKKRGKLTIAGKPGQNVAALAKRKLKAGRYKLMLTARDAAGNVSAPLKLAFKVKSRR
jgi:hypothetical protein